MTSSEKRHFKLYFNREVQNKDFFILLFDVIDKYEDPNIKIILSAIPNIKKSQLSNIKAHLTHQILTSLRSFNRNHSVELQLRELIDFAVIYYEKGMYNLALATISKARKKALETGYHSILLTLLEKEKLIESQYITGSMSPKANEIVQSTIRILDQINTTHHLSNLSISLYSHSLQFGYVKNDEDYRAITEYFKQNLPPVDYEKLSFFSKMYYLQSYAWYYNMIQDFKQNNKYAQQWVNLFKSSPEMMIKEMSLYIKAYHNLLNSLFMLRKSHELHNILEEYIKIPQTLDQKLSPNQESLHKLFYYIHAINHIYLSADYELGKNIANELGDILKINSYNWDKHRMLVFYYKIACIYFGNGDLDNTLQYLNKILNEVSPNFREDIQCFARILALICHFDLGNDQLVNYQIVSIYRFLSKRKQNHKVLIEIMKFLKKIVKTTRDNLNEEFNQLKQRLEELKKDPFERRPFLYLDILSWLDSKQENVPVIEILQRKIKTKEAG